MPRTTISTGNVSLDVLPEKNRPDASAQSAGAGIKKSDHCHIVLLADFSGRGHRGLQNASSINTHKIIEVNRDNFDEVFAQMDVRCALPYADDIRFSELDEMHPDYLFEELDLFQQFRSLKKKLNSPDTFAAAAREIYSWHSERSVQDTNQTNASTMNITQNGSLLDSILSGTELPASGAGGFDLQGLVRDIVAPYVLPKPDPQQKELLETVDLAASELMRKLMHHRNFQSLESAWRSLYLLVRRLETDSRLKLFIVDVSQQVLIEDALSVEASAQMQLHKLLVDNRSALGSKPFNVMMVDALFGQSEDDIATLAKLGDIAASTNALLVTGASTQLAGCQDLGKTPDCDDWHFSPDTNVKSAWDALRSSRQAANIIAVAPRYLSRLPYGKKSAPIERFNFEELPDAEQHGFYLWSNGAWLVSYILAQGFVISGDVSRQQVFEIERLPLHVFNRNGESMVTPCAEVNMLDPSAAALSLCGLTVIRSILNKDAVMIPALMSLAC
jgi:type VI secretion system protein ImpC